ncbi:hypothetical protein KEM48_004470 [Puccinia striiformis f. sp. tritici PST-130]|nr:hypothetical protein KEM48_004470 [Puccinia striiformis f. sp. tritici PST-130]
MPSLPNQIHSPSKKKNKLVGLEYPGCKTKITSKEDGQLSPYPAEDPDDIHGPGPEYESIYRAIRTLKEKQNPPVDDSQSRGLLITVVAYNFIFLVCVAIICLPYLQGVDGHKRRHWIIKRQFLDAQLDSPNSVQPEPDRTANDGASPSSDPDLSPGILDDLQWQQGQKLSDFALFNSTSVHFNEYGLKSTLLIHRFRTTGLFWTFMAVPTFIVSYLV